MKTFFLTILLVATMSTGASAQQLYLGARFDISAMKWTFSDNYRVPVEYPFHNGSLKPLWGIQVSFPVEYRLHKRLGIQTEIGFAKRGFAIKLKGSESGYEINATTRTVFKYFDFPLLLKGYLVTGEKEFYLLAGPSWSKARSGKIQVTVTVSGGGDSETESDSEPLDLDDFPKVKTDYGLYAGLGYSKGNERFRFFMEGRYYHGLKKQSEAGAEETIYNRGIMFSTGLMFGLFHK